MKDGAPGVVSRALRIDSDGPLVVFPNLDISASKMPELSMIIDFYLESIPEGSKGWLLNHDNGGYDRALVLHDERFNGITHGVGYPAGPVYDTYTTPETGKWIQMVVTYRQGGECAVFVSNEKAPITHEGRNNDGSSSLILGRVLKYPNHWCDCWIKGVSVYDKGLSDEEVDAVFGKFKEEIVVPSGEARGDESVDQGEDEDDHVDPYDKVWNYTKRRFQSVSSGNFIDGRAPGCTGEQVYMTPGRTTNTLCFDWELAELSDGTSLIKNLRSNYYLDGRDKGSSQGNHVALRNVTEDEAKASNNFKWIITEHSYNGKTRRAFKSVSSGYQLDGRRTENIGACLGLTQRNPEGDSFLLWDMSDAEEPMIETTYPKYTQNRISSASSGNYMDGRAPGYYDPFITPGRTTNTLCFDWELCEVSDGIFLIKNLRSLYYLAGHEKGVNTNYPAIYPVTEDVAKDEDEFKWIVTEHLYNGKTRRAFESVSNRGAYLSGVKKSGNTKLNFRRGENPEGNAALLWDF